MPRRPDFNLFHQSISKELFAVKDRIRNLVKHWGTDGEHKEVALRSILRKHLPESAIIGRGFIVTEHESSTQIDILIVDSRKPTLFKEGDLMIVTPDSVLAVIEVKTRQRTYSNVKETLTKLSEIESLCNGLGTNDLWTGLFVFEGESDSEADLAEKQQKDDDQLRDALRAVGNAQTATGKKVNCVSCGHNQFIRFWKDGNREANSPINGEVWHSYLLEGVAPSYFIGNLIDHISRIDNRNSAFAWFPQLGGKEAFRKNYVKAGTEEVKTFPY